MKNDPKAFEALVRRHHRRLMAYAISITKSEAIAEDIVQDSFIAAWENLGRFDEKRDFGTWMRGIVRNKCREQVRKNRLVLCDDDFLEALEARHENWDLEASQAEDEQSLFDALGSCLTKLPDLLSQAVELFYLQRLDGAAAASEAGAGESAFRKRLQRARVQLGQCIETQISPS